MGEMAGDDFRLNHCGGELAECIGALVTYKAQSRALDESRDAAAVESVRRGRENFLRSEEERKKQRAENEAELAGVGANGAGLFG